MIDKVGIIGLGLIGGSMAKAITEHTNHPVYAYNRTHQVVLNAIKDGSIKDELTNENANEIDLLIIALYPKDVDKVLEKFIPHLKKNTIVVDCTGVKISVCNDLSKRLKDLGLRFVGGHPMAGKEVAGYDNAEGSLYDNASMILCRDEYTDEDAFLDAKKFFSEVGFLRVTESTPKEHDQVIAFTSQMAHVVSNAYVKSPTLDKRYGFSAGSFKDLTRVAKLNEYMWTDLFLANKEPLLDEIDIFIEHMNEFRQALSNEDKDKLIDLLGEGRRLKEEDEEKDKCQR